MIKFLQKKIKAAQTNEMKINYKQQHSFEKRKSDSDKILAKYPNRIPVIVERFGDDVPDIDRSKYLVPEDLTMANFMYVIRKRIKLEPEKAIYLFVDNKIMTGIDFISVIYERYHDEDGFLYVKYSGESTFG